MFETLKIIRDVVKTVKTAREYLEANKDKVDAVNQIIESLKILIPPVAAPLEKIQAFLEKLL